MYKKSELEEKLKLNYPDVIFRWTNIRRAFNINSLVPFILKDIKENKLSYKQKERRILLYSTDAGEQIYIQYPGLYSANGKLPYDFKPVAVLADGTTAIDMDFEFIWRILEKYIVGHKNLMGILNTLFFRMGRMCDYTASIDDSYKTFLIEGENNQIEDTMARLSLYKLLFSDNMIMQSLNFLAEDIDAGNNNSMSLEAFLYYFELLIQIEDCKYNYEKTISEAGRITSTDALIIVSSYSNNQIDLADMLMRFVRYRGVAKCEIDEYPFVTNGMVSIIPYKNHIESLCENNNIEYNRKRAFSFNGGTISTKYQIPQKHILLTEERLSNEQFHEIEKTGWKIYSTEEYVFGDNLNALDNIILDTEDYFDSLDRINVFLKENKNSRLRFDRKIIKNKSVSIKPLYNFHNIKTLVLDNQLSKDQQDYLNENNYRYVVLDEISNAEDLEEKLLRPLKQFLIKIEEKNSNTIIYSGKPVKVLKPVIKNKKKS